MLNENNLFDGNFFRANLIPADIKLYVVTKDKLTNIGSFSLLNDILILLAFLAWGSFFLQSLQLNPVESFHKLPIRQFHPIKIFSSGLE